ncbi:MAG: hypothetical protein IJH38_01665 [Clostridia bacterium]|nr:hypothetical protein [Clostridia bacterium]
MRFSENRVIAFIVLAVCILVSVFGLGGMAVARERNKVLSVYDRGADPSLSTRHSVDAYLDSASENASLMASEAGLHRPSSKTIDDVAELADKLATVSDTNARYEVFSSLKTAVDKLYDDMYREVEGADFKNFKVAYDNFWENVNMIKYDDYGKLAARYNDMISGFPASIVAGIAGQGALNTFGG